MTNETGKLIEEALEVMHCLGIDNLRAKGAIILLTEALRRAETERDAQAKEFARFKAVAALGNSVARWDSLLNEMHEQKARAQRAERERDAQAALVATRTAERDEARVQLRAANDFLRVVTLERDHAQQVEVPDAFWQRDEAQAQVWGLICVATNGQWRERDQTERTQRNLSFMGACLDEEQRKVAELTATRDLLTAENARLQQEVATLELLQRGEK